MVIHMEESERNRYMGLVWSLSGENTTFQPRSPGSSLLSKGFKLEDR